MGSFELDASIRPQDDLFGHVNTSWVQEARIPDHRGRYGRFIEVADRAENQIRDLIFEMDAPSTGEGGERAKIRCFFDAFMKEKEIEDRGIQCLGLADIDAIGSSHDLLAWMGRGLRTGLTGLIGAAVEVDLASPTRYALYLGQGGLGLPGEDYYRLSEHSEILDSYQKYVGDLLERANRPPSGAEGVLALESAIACSHWDRVRCRDYREMYNPVPYAELPDEWRDLLGAAGVDGIKDVIIMQPSYFSEVTSLLSEFDLDCWRDWVRFHLLDDRAPLLDSATGELFFDMYSRKLHGIPEQRERWRRGVLLTQRYLGELVSRVYVARHFSEGRKARVLAMIEQLRTAFRSSLNRTMWMSSQTRDEALRKLERLTAKIGYPDHWRDYSGVAIDANDVIRNVELLEEFEFDDGLRKLCGRIRGWEWFMPAHSINAYYHPARNEIVFPAGILQSPFYDSASSDAENYGSIGAIIGHEIGHALDDQGSKCDADGVLRDWWAPADRAAYEELTSAAVQQYDGLELAQVPGVGVNGALTLGENIGDIGGLGVAYRAWRAAAGASVRDEDARIFFLSWARTWASKSRDEALREQLTNDTHCPSEIRCNRAAMNLDAFHEMFATKPTDRMWLAPDQRVAIW